MRSIPLKMDRAYAIHSPNKKYCALSYRTVGGAALQAGSVVELTLGPATSGPAHLAWQTPAHAPLARPS